MIGLMGMGVGTLIIAMAPSSIIYMAVIGALFFGFMNPVTMGPFYAVIQTNVEPDMQARVFTLLSSVGGGMAPVGLMIAGPVADSVGIKSWFFVGSIFCILMSLAGLLMPVVMNIEENRLSTLEKHQVQYKGA